MSDLFFYKNPIPMWIYDLSTLSFLEVNEAAQISYEYDREEFLSMTIKDIRPREDIERLLIHASPKNEGYEDAGYWRHIKKSGETIFVQIISQVIDYQGIKSELILSIDQTDKVTALINLKEKESQIESILQSLTDIVWSCDPETYSVFFMNKHVFEVFGYTQEEFFANSQLWFECIHEEDKQMVKNALSELKDKNDYDLEYRILTKDKRIRTIHDKCKVIRNEITGKAERLDGITRDISKEKAYIENIKTLSENLKKQNEQLKELAFINSHKMRGPLTSIVGALNILDEIQEKNNIIDMIKNAAMELDQVIIETSHKLSGTMENENFSPFDKNKIHKILQIDDDSLQLLLNERMIKRFNPEIDVVSYSDAKLALDFIQQTSIDLILLDINMPIMNGWEFLEELDNASIKQNVYLLSSSIDPSDRLRAQKFQNVKGYLTKPLTENELKNAFC